MKRNRILILGGILSILAGISLTIILSESYIKYLNHPTTSSVLKLLNGHIRDLWGVGSPTLPLFFLVLGFSLMFNIWIRFLSLLVAVLFTGLLLDAFFYLEGSGEKAGYVMSVAGDKLVSYLGIVGTWVLLFFFLGGIMFILGVDKPLVILLKVVKGGKGLERRRGASFGSIPTLETVMGDRAPKSSEIPGGEIKAEGLFEEREIEKDKGMGKERFRLPTRAASFERADEYKLPDIALLDPISPIGKKASTHLLEEKAASLEEKLSNYGVSGRVVSIHYGPVVTMFEFQPSPGIKVSKIANLSEDIALAMKALGVRIVAPIPGKDVVGIEIPNDRREPVFFREVISSERFKRSASTLTMALGKDIFGYPFVADLKKMPHLLVAGATGSGKSVGLNTIICSILFRATPREVKFILVDPKMLEFSVYNGIPHLITPVITDPKKAAIALNWAVIEMERRYSLLTQMGVRNIESYNRHTQERLCFVVIVIDELADLMMVASKDVESLVARLAQKARAAGIHLVVATQRPSVDVITGLIKANFPSRASFKVSSKVDSRTILDAMGAEKLLGLGDMLFLPPGTSELTRLHGAYISDGEISRIANFWKEQEEPEFNEEVVSGASLEEVEWAISEEDELYPEAVELVVRTGHASASMIQRYMKIGYNRAARMIDRMEREGIVGPAQGSKPREVIKRVAD